jgi:YVTN family beta-propeller protein
MSQRFRRITVLFCGILGVTQALADPDSFLRPEADIPLTGGVSRFEYQTFDPQTDTLYIAHMGAGQIIAFNTRTERIYTLTGFPGVTGLLVIPDKHRLYASVTRQHQVAVIDTQNLKTLARIPAGNFPDSMAYIPELNQLYVSDERSGEVTVIDLEKNKRVASIKLGGRVGNTRYDSSSRFIYVTVPKKNELVAIDPQTRKISARYQIRGGKHPHGLLIDPNARLAFIGCEKDQKLTVMDLKTFQEIGFSPVGRDPDIMALDPQLGYLYVASESGSVYMFRIRNRKLEKIDVFPVGENAHSVEVDPKTHFVYFPLRQVNKQPVLRIMKPAN